MEHTNKKRSWPVYTVVLSSPILSMALGVGVTILFQIQQTSYSNLIVNLFFLGGCILPVGYLDYTRNDLGLRVVDHQVKSHVLLSLAVFSLYLLFYIFVIRISGLKPVTSATIWGLVTFAIVVFTEEVYFRGVLYRFFETRISGITALILSSILFGLIHARQGWGGMLSKAFSGWLWGSVRYSTGMIFLLIFPVHFFFNTVWLLFEGNWADPPAWGKYGLPMIEFLLGALFVILHNKNISSKEI